jgi:hypothetical protein
MSEQKIAASYHELVKACIVSKLEKAGSSLDEFEKTCANLDTIEGVTKFGELVEKIADGVGPISSMLSLVKDPATAVTNMAVESAIPTLLGSGAGIGALYHKAENDIFDIHKSLDDRKKQIQLIRNATTQLKQEYGVA